MESSVPTMLLLLGNQSIYQKFFSARTERDARLSVVGWLGGTVLLEILIVAHRRARRGAVPPHPAG